MSAGDGIVVKGLGTAGVADPDVLTVQGVAGGTPLAVSAPLSKRPVYFAATVNTPILLLLAGVAGRQWVLLDYSAYLQSVAGAALAFSTMYVLDGATQIWEVPLLVPAVVAGQALTDRQGSGLSLSGTLGASMTVGMPAGGAFTYCHLSINATLV
jgi:hypothetical protein